MQLALLPLLVTAFFIQSVIPALGLPFHIVLLLDDASSFIVAVALVVAVPYAQIWSKVVSMAYCCSSMYVLMHNAIIEMPLPNPEPIKIMAFVIYLTLFSLALGASIQLGLFERETNDSVKYE